MAAASWIEYVRLAHFSRSVAERKLCRLLKRRRAVRIFEVGIVDVQRTGRLLRIAERYASGHCVKYAALDAFDARSKRLPRLSLIEAHRALNASGATVRLLPGDPAMTLPNVANSHTGTDLLILAPWIGSDALGDAWRFVPRMLRADSTVLRLAQCDDRKAAPEMLTPADIDQLAARYAPRRAA